MRRIAIVSALVASACSRGQSTIDQPAIATIDDARVFNDAAITDDVVASAVTGFPCLTATYGFASDSDGSIQLERIYEDGRVVRGRMRDGHVPSSSEPMFVADIYDYEGAEARSIYVWNLDGDTISAAPYGASVSVVDYDDALLALTATISAFPQLSPFDDNQIAGLYLFAGSDIVATGWQGGTVLTSLLLAQVVEAPPAPPPVVMPRPVVPPRPVLPPAPVVTPRPTPVPRPPILPPVVPRPIQGSGQCPAPVNGPRPGQPQPQPQPTQEQITEIFLRERDAVQMQCGQDTTIQQAQHIPWMSGTTGSALERCQNQLRNPPSWADVQNNMNNRTGTCSLGDYLCLSRSWLFCAAAAGRGGGENGVSACRGILIEFLLNRQGIRCSNPVPAECQGVGNALRDLLPAQ